MGGLVAVLPHEHALSSDADLEGPPKALKDVLLHIWYTILLADGLDLQQYGVGILAFGVWGHAHS